MIDSDLNSPNCVKQEGEHDEDDSQQPSEIEQRHELLDFGPVTWGLTSAKRPVALWTSARYAGITFQMQVKVVKPDGMFYCFTLVFFCRF